MLNIFKYWTNVLKHPEYFVSNVQADRQTQVSENFVSYFRTGAASSSRLAVLVQLLDKTGWMRKNPQNCCWVDRQKDRQTDRETDGGTDTGECELCVLFQDRSSGRSGMGNVLPDGWTTHRVAVGESLEVQLGNAAGRSCCPRRWARGPARMARMGGKGPDCA